MLTAFDKALLNILQTELPLAPRPFAVIAAQLASSEEAVLGRIKELQQLGYIRRIGPFFDSAKLGFVSTLVAVKVAPEHVESVALAINAYPGVTHNYEREGAFNLWFTLLTINEEEQLAVLNCIEQLEGVLALMNLPARKKYKVSVEFRL